MRYLIGHIFVLLLLVGAFFAPAILSIDTSLSLEPGIVLAQEVEVNLVDEQKSVGESINPFHGSFVFLLKAVGALFITIGAMLLWLTGVLLNYAISFSILNFDIFATITGVPIAWTVLRDITNVFFIFIFLATGIATILGLQNYGAKKIIPLLLLIAVLINFSLFFTKVGIDIAHGFAGAILNQAGVAGNNCDLVLTAGNATGPVGQYLTRAEGSIDCFLNHGVAAAFIEQFGFLDYWGETLQNPLDNDDDAVFNGSADTMGEGFRAMIFGFFAFIFMSAASIVFLGGAVILIIRIVKLIILMITSAPAMAAYILPGTRKFWNSWLEEFIREVFFAPIFLLLIAISLLFLNTARGALVGNTDISFGVAFIYGGVSGVSLIIYFLVALGFLFMSIKLAQEMKVSGAKTAMGIQKWGQGIAGRTAIGLPARNIQRVYNRAISRAPSAVRGTLRTIGVDQAITDNLDSAQSNTFGSSYSVKTLDEAGKKRDKTIRFEQLKAEVEEALKSSDAGKIQTAVQKLSLKETVDLGNDLSGTDLENFAKNLTPERFKKFMESDDLSDSAQGEAAKARFEKLSAAVTAGTAKGMEDAFKELSNDELDVAPKDIVINGAAHAKAAQAEHIQKSNAYTSTEKKAFKDERFKEFNAAVATSTYRDHPDIKDRMKNFGDGEIVKFDEAVLAKQAVGYNLSPGILKKLQDERNLSEATRNSIAGAVKIKADSGDTGMKKFLQSPPGMYWQVATP